jgi:NitT/TauT family transport system substrate-binding protein
VTHHVPLASAKITAGPPRISRTRRPSRGSPLLRSVLLLCAVLAGSVSTPRAAFAESIRVAVGHQSICTDTYTAGIIVKELGLLEKLLPRDAQYADVEYEIEWRDYDSGPPITNMMLANKLDFGVMGDYPLIVNGAKFQETESLRSVYVAGTGYNLKGTGNAIVVPKDSDVYALVDLKGKSLSVPVGSAAWGMTLAALQKAGISADEIQIKNQSPPVGAANIAQGKIDAHADFCPWSELMEFRGTGRKIYDGSDAGVPYLHGLVVRKDFADAHPEIVVGFIKAIVAAGDWVREDPARAATKLEEWTGVEREVQYLYFSRGGYLTLDPTIKPAWVEALEADHAVLARERSIPPLDFDTWIDDAYIRRAYAELGLDYEKETANVVDAKIEYASLPPAEMWDAKEGLLEFASVSEMMSAYQSKVQADPKAVRATYVYDHAAKLKLFGHVAFYAKLPDGSLQAYLRKSDAETAAAGSGGEVTTFAKVVGASSAAGSAAAR